MTRLHIMHVTNKYSQIVIHPCFHVMYVTDDVSDGVLKRIIWVGGGGRVFKEEYQPWKLFLIKL